MANRQRKKSLYAPGRELVENSNTQKQNSAIAPDNIDVIGNTLATGGLSVSTSTNNKQKQKQQSNGASDEKNDGEVTIKTGASTPLENISLEQKAPLTEDQKAIRELLGGDADGGDDDEGSKLVIPVGQDSYGMTSRVSEKDAFLRDINDLPDQVCYFILDKQKKLIMMN